MPDYAATDQTPPAAVGPVPAAVPGDAPRLFGRWGLALAAIALTALALGFMCERYLASGSFIDHIEDSSVIAAWQYLHGTPLYGQAEGAPHAATYYGPLFYLAQAWSLQLFGPSLLAGKLLSLGALLATLLMLGGRFLRGAPLALAPYPILYLVGGLLLFSPVSYWVRPDPFETLFVAVAIVLGGSPLAVGICIGLAVNCKIHAFFYFTPIVIELWRLGGWRALLRVAVAAGAAFLLPFLAPGISLHDYASALAQQVGGRLPSTEEFGPILLYTTVMCVPIAMPLLALPRPWAERIYPWSCLATVVLLLYPAMFPGAGAYHFMPLLPVLAEARHRLRPQEPGTELDLLPMLVAAAGGMHLTLGDIAITRGFGPIAGEALEFAQAGDVRRIEIGYGDSKLGYGASQLGRTLLTLHGYPAHYDAQLLMELRQIGIDQSARWIPDLAECRVERWLLPKGERPFSVVSYFYDGAPLFGDGFRAAFAEHYRRVAATAHFDVWDCIPRR